MGRWSQHTYIMEILFILLGFSLFVKGFTGPTLYGEIGGTVVFQCTLNATSMKEQTIKSVSFQKEFNGRKELIIGYDAVTNETERKRKHTYLNHTDNTVTLRNLKDSDGGKYKCYIRHKGVSGGDTEDTETTLFIIDPPPTPTITTQCNVSCALNCTADTKDLELTYEWKEDEGEWTEGNMLKNINSSDTTEKFFCRLRTLVRPSNTSMPMANPLHKPVPGLTGGQIAGISFGIAVIAVIVVIAALVRCRPHHPFSMFVLQCIVCDQQPGNPVPLPEEFALTEDLEMEPLNNKKIKRRQINK